MIRRLAVGALTLLLGACSSGGVQKDSVRTSQAQQAAPEAFWTGEAKTEGDSRYRAVIGTKGMVASDDREASEWGAEILRQGGNAVDAAVATAFALAVSRPHYGSLGGGGFMVYCPKPSGGKSSPCSVIDYREQAPGGASRDMFVKDGKARTDLSQDGALASGVPGVTAGLLLALEKHGKFSRQKVLARPIEMARRGTVFTGHMEGMADYRWPAFNDEAKRVLGCPSGASAKERKICPPGTVIKQPDLARVLEEISRRGRDGFYKGWVAEKIAAGLVGAGGIMTARDLAEYQAKEREPVRTTYRGYEVVTMPPPSSGGALILQLLKYAELADGTGAFDQGFSSAKSLHAIIHGMSLAFADRAQYFGDPDHVKVPLDRVLSESYLRERWGSTYKSGKAALPEAAGRVIAENANTTHFSVIDREGNAVAVTTTVNDAFGSGFVPAGTGVFMNNEMDDFSTQPGVPNLYGLIGSEANAVAPRKRPLSSMSPTIVRDAATGEARIVVGAQGGPRIITSVYQTLLNRLRFGMSLPDAVYADRVHHQWRPMAVTFEPFSLSPDTVGELRSMGYEMKQSDHMAKQHAIERFASGRVWGVADPRTEGAAVAE